MSNASQIRPKLVLSLFIFQVLINWFYILWARELMNSMASGWFVVTPIIGFFYFFFAMVASIGLYYKMRLALVLGYAIILFGLISDVISYNAAILHDGIFGWLIIPLIILSSLTIICMALNQDCFKAE